MDRDYYIKPLLENYMGIREERQIRETDPYYKYIGNRDIKYYKDAPKYYNREKGPIYYVDYKMNNDRISFGEEERYDSQELQRRAAYELERERDLIIAREREDRALRRAERLRLEEEHQQNERLRLAAEQAERLRLEEHQQEEHRKVRERAERQWFSEEQLAELRVQEDNRQELERKRLIKEEDHKQRILRAEEYRRQRIRREEAKRIEQQKKDEKRKAIKNLLNVKVYFKHEGPVSDKLYDMVIAKHAELCEIMNIELIGVTPESKKGCQYNRFPVALVSIKDEHYKYPVVGLTSCIYMINKITNMVEYAMSSDTINIQNIILQITKHAKELISRETVDDVEPQYDLDDITEMTNKNSILVEKLKRQPLEYSIVITE